MAIYQIISILEPSLWYPNRELIEGTIFELNSKSKITKNGILDVTVIKSRYKFYNIHELSIHGVKIKKLFK